MGVGGQKKQNFVNVVCKRPIKINNNQISIWKFLTGTLDCITMLLANDALLVSKALLGYD